MNRAIKVVLLFALIFIFAGAAFGMGKEKKNKEIDVLLHQQIEMNDGVKLAANIYKPAEQKEPLPAIFAFTPYVSDEAQERGAFFAKNGYVYVHVDVRGRGNSQGKFFPLEKDGSDGARVVEWIAEQPWCNGKVAMRGGSYRGMVQWQTLKHFPPALKTIVPTAAAAPGIDFPIINNIFESYVAQWLALTAGRTQNIRLFSDNKYWRGKFYEMYSKHIPFSKLAEITGSNREIFKRWVAHPFYDDYWRERVVPNESYKKIDIPILTITGHFDGDQPGALHYFRKHMQFGKEDAKKQHYLIIGPWSHAGTRRPAKTLSGLTFGDNSVLDMEQLHLEWYDWILKGKKKPKLLKKRICYYMMAENQWKYCDNLADTASGVKTFYLSSRGGRAQDVFQSGFLHTTRPGGKQQADTFKYDPLKLLSKEDYFDRLAGDSLHQGDAFAEDKLVYHSPPLEEDLEIAGQVKLRAYIELNVPDTDLTMSLYEIRKDGRSIPLARDFKRARYRESLNKEKLAVPGKVYEYLFQNSYFFARRLKKGSRLRLIISCVNSPAFEKNYNSGGVVSKETAKDARTAVVKLYHSGKYPSVLELPVKLETKDKKKMPAPEMVLIPAGEFMMGKSEKESHDYYPAHKVFVDSFYIDKYEVTNAEYYRYCIAAGKSLPKFWGIDEFRCGPDYPRHPVVGVSQYEAKEYAKWRGVRLPTEAEWEYAARGGLQGKSFPLGDDFGPEDGNLSNRSDGSAKVGSFKPNGFGLYDMAGNVREWVEDFYDETYYQNSPYHNPKGPETGKFVVIRGGGWFAGKSCGRIFVREALKNTWIDFNVGFRCVRSVSPNKQEAKK